MPRFPILKNIFGTFINYIALNDALLPKTISELNFYFFLLYKYDETPWIPLS